MKNRIWIIIFSAAAVICAGLWLLINSLFPASNTVGIYQDGSLVRKIDLNTVTDSYEIVLTGKAGKNTVLVSPGNIEMKSAECPDKICVNHGQLKSGGSPIVCLPNRIIIKYENPSQEIDVN